MIKTEGENHLSARTVSNFFESIRNIKYKVWLTWNFHNLFQDNGWRVIILYFRMDIAINWRKRVQTNLKFEFISNTSGLHCIYIIYTTNRFQIVSIFKFGYRFYLLLSRAIFCNNKKKNVRHHITARLSIDTIFHFLSIHFSWVVSNGGSGSASLYLYTL